MRDDNANRSFSRSPNFISKAVGIDFTWLMGGALDGDILISKSIKKKTFRSSRKGLCGSIWGVNAVAVNHKEISIRGQARDGHFADIRHD